jgi:hypothetical protein
MSASLLDADPIYATVDHTAKAEARESTLAVAVPPVRLKPPGDLKLTQSLSKPDSDLLVSPLGEEDGGLNSCCESVANCSSGNKQMERSPSFASEWDEVILWVLWVG